MKRIEKDIENQVQSKLSKYYNDQFLGELLTVQQKKAEQKTAKRNLKFLPALITCALIFVITISCVSFYYLSPNEPAKKEYSVTNQNLEDISLEELNEALSDITFLDKDIVILTKCSDEYYNEILFYSIGLESDEVLISTDITIVVNPDYPNIFDGSNYITGTFKNYEIKYFINSSYEDEVYNYEVHAKIITEHERIFIDYEEFAFEEGNSFFDYLAQIIQ